MARRVRRDLTIFFPGVGAQLIVSTSPFVLPFVVGALIAGARFDERSAGFLLSMEAIAAALTTVSISAWTQPRSRRRWALAGAIMAIAGNASSLISPALPLLVAARLVAGVGAGIVAAEVSAVVARGLNRERLISWLTAAAIVNGSIWLYVIPNLPEALGYRTPYLILLATCLAGALLLTRTPSPPVRRAIANKADIVPAGRAIGFAVLPAIFLTQLGQGSFWTLVAIYGANAGLKEETIGAFLSLATLMLLLGVAGTGLAGVRFGRFTPMFALVIVNVLSIMAISFSRDANVYFAANAVQAVTNLSSLVYQLGIAAAVDRTGRLFAAANGLVALGNGVGPAVAGAIALPFGAPSVAFAVAAFNVLAVLLFALVAAGVSRRTVVLRA